MYSIETLTELYPIQVMKLHYNNNLSSLSSVNVSCRAAFDMPFMPDNFSLYVSCSTFVLWFWIYFSQIYLLTCLFKIHSKRNLVWWLLQISFCKEFNFIPERFCQRFPRVFVINSCQLYETFVHWHTYKDSFTLEPLWDWIFGADTAFKESQIF